MSTEPMLVRTEATNNTMLYSYNNIYTADSQRNRRFCVGSFIGESRQYYTSAFFISSP